MKTALLPDLGHFETEYDGHEIINWDHPSSLTWLTRTPANRSFAKLARFFEPQADKFMCGPASIAIILNCLKMGSRQFIPFDSEHESFPRRMNAELPTEYRTSFQRFTQKNLFLNCAHVKLLAEVYGAKPGLTLEEMNQIVLAHNLLSNMHYATPETQVVDFEAIARALSSDNTFVIANFDRAVWGLKGGGHISPIAAVDLISQKALIMDVNMCGEWLWIDMSLLLKSMMSLDGNSPRGFLVLTA